MDPSSSSRSRETADKEAGLVHTVPHEVLEDMESKDASAREHFGDGYAPTKLDSKLHRALMAEIGEEMIEHTASQGIRSNPMFQRTVSQGIRSNPMLETTASQGIHSNPMFERTVSQGIRSTTMLVRTVLSGLRPRLLLLKCETAGTRSKAAGEVN